MYISINIAKFFKLSYNKNNEIIIRNIKNFYLNIYILKGNFL